MRSRFSIVRGAALAVTAVFTLGLATAPAADAAPASPAPAVPQPAGYSIHGYNFNSGNYRGAIDAQTGDLWLTSVSPMFTWPSPCTSADLTKPASGSS